MDWQRYIKLIRFQFDLSQTELAQSLGVSQAAVSEWETGKSHPSATAQAILKDRYRCRTEDPLISSVAMAVQHSPHPACLMELVGGELVFRKISQSLFHATSILLRSDADHPVFPRLGEEITELQMQLIEADIWDGDHACALELGTAVRDNIRQPAFSTHSPIRLDDGRRFLRVDTRMLSEAERDSLSATRPPLDLIPLDECA